MKKYATHLGLRSPSRQSAKDDTPTRRNVISLPAAKGTQTDISTDLKPNRLNDSFLRTHSGKNHRTEDERFAQVQNTDFIETKKRVVDNDPSALAKGLVSEEQLKPSRDVFYRYAGVVPDEKSLQNSRIGPIKKYIRQQVANWNARKENSLIQAFKKCKAEEMASFGFALGVQSARYFDKGDAVDFMLLLTEILAKMSHQFDINCPRYTKFAVSMEVEAEDFRRFSIKIGEENYKLNLFVPISVRGRLAFLAAAEGDEICKTQNPQIMQEELVKRSEEIARVKCALLFKQHWYLFDDEPYRNVYGPKQNTTNII